MPIRWLLVLSCVVCLPQTSHAYLDPGTGSYVLQMLLGLVVGSLFAIRLCWQRIRAFFSRIFGRSPRNDDDKR